MALLKKGKTRESNIKSYHFLPRKYGKDLLMDVARIETLRDFVLDSTPHQISFYEILFIEKGKGSFSLDENRTTLRPGTVIFTSPGQVRRWNAQKVRGYTLFFEKDFLGLFFTDELFLYRFQYFHQYSRPTAMMMPAKTFHRILELIRNLEEEFRQLQSDSNHFLRAILYQLLIVLNRCYSTAYLVQSNTHVHPDFFRFRALLEKQFMSQHRVTYYTQMLRISSAHLNKICRQYSGLSAQKMIHHKLASEIKKQLRCNFSVKEIAYEFDFSDPSNFNRFFKKLTGATAQQYRDGL
jgi:AraC-like DNA-binding protein/mannose-6-phosphate isomerase-like protein (cupin superfamily)